MNSSFLVGAAVSYVISAVFLGLGFHKMFVYENPGSISFDSVNAYVGGDAYNYIINANYATGYFTLAIFCAVLGMTFVLSYLIVNNGGKASLTSSTNIVQPSSNVEVIKEEF